MDLYAICADFVGSVNRLLARMEVELDPPGFGSSSFQDDTVNLVQINVRGRILQVAFSATAELISTEDFRVPYTLQGTIRAFNQELLEKDIIEEQLIFLYPRTPQKDVALLRRPHLPLRTRSIRSI